MPMTIVITVAIDEVNVKLSVQDVGGVVVWFCSDSAAAVLTLTSAERGPSPSEFMALME
jgi:hypothetical protein